MNYRISLPVAVISLALAGGVATTSFAQVAPPNPAQTEAQAQTPAATQAHYRDGKRRGERGHHDARRGGERDQHGWRRHASRGGHRGMCFGGFGGRGGSGIFLSIFKQADADKNKELTQEEITAFRSAKISEADTSGEGSLSIEEFDTLYREFTRSRMVDLFQEIDADGDGNISPAELDDKLGSFVERMDRDGDGVLKLQRPGRRG